MGGTGGSRTCGRSCLPDRPNDDLDRPRNRDSKQHADKAPEEATDPAADVGANEHGNEDEQRIHLDGAAHDDGVEEVVLEECVDQEDDEGHNPRGQGVPQGKQHRRNASEGTADRREEVDESDPQAEEQRIGHAKRGERDEDNDPGDDGREDIPHDEARD